MKIQNKKYQILCLFLIALNLSFIWGNSMMSGPESSEISSGVLAWVTETLGTVIPNGEHVIRKLAHFSEFACLGLLFGWLSVLRQEKGFHLFAMPLLFGSMSALVDETIQVLVPGRGPSVVDVWIDTAGVAAGILLLLLGYSIARKHKQKSIGGN